jgi:hypothetical protein
MPQYRVMPGVGGLMSRGRGKGEMGFSEGKLGKGITIKM